MKLTATSVALIALILLAGIVQQWGPQGSVPWWRYFAALFVLGLLYEWWTARSAQFELQAPLRQQLRLGKPEALHFSLGNSGSRARRIEYACELPEAFELINAQGSLYLAPGETHSISIDVLPRTLLTHELTQLPIRVLGNLRLAAWTRHLSTRTELTVIPDRQRVGRTIDTTRSSGNATHMAGTGFELHRLREYQPGDPLRSISWKVSARSQTLVTRVFSEEQRPSTILVLDVGRSSSTRIEGMSLFAHYVNMAATFTGEAIAAGEQVGLVAAAATPQQVLPPATGREAALRIHNALGKLQPQPVEVNLIAAALTAQKIARGRSLIIYFTDLYSQSLEGNLGRSLALWSQRHQTMLVGLVGEEVVALSEKDSVTERDAYNSLAAATYRRNLQVTAQGARRQGTRVILASPNNLQSEVLGEYQRLKSLRRV